VNVSALQDVLCEDGERRTAGQQFVEVAAVVFGQLGRSALPVTPQATSPAL
jgi:hypothetical protein